MKTLFWAFFFGGVHAALAADVNSPVAASGIQGAVTYPAGATQQGAPPNPANRPSIAVPTPDTLPLQGGAASSPFSSNSSTATGTAVTTSLGRYRNAKGEVRIEDLIHDRYKQSVVRVTARDLAGNILARAMGVSVGHGNPYIAVPLSLVLGSSQQWADRIEITHLAGNQYDANVALIDEEKNLALLSPEAAPAPIVFAREGNERPQIDVFAISFENAPDGTLTSSIHRGRLAAANVDTGLLSVSAATGQVIDDSQAGTGLINSDGNLVGMLLPGGRGVLASTLDRAIEKASRATPISPSMIGVILGRGVLVDPKLPGAYRSISAALDAIKLGTAPKADRSRYTPARTRAVAPTKADKVVVKVMPGTYREKKTIVLPSNISLSGSSPSQTVLVGADPGKPVVLIQKARNVMVAALRLTPAPLQNLKAPALIVSQASNVTLLGNVFEAKGGVAVWTHDSQNVSLFGNTFPRGTQRAVSCDKTNLVVEANAFLGDWPIGISVDKECGASIHRNLFLDNKNSISVASTSATTVLQMNTFVRSPAAVKLAGTAPRFSLQDNIFYECAYGLYAGGDMPARNLGRNAAWKSKFYAHSRPIPEADLVRTEPTFVAPENYDFRIQPGKGQVGAALRTPGADLGAFQRSDFLGPYSGTLARSLGSLGGENSDYAKIWQLNE